MDRVLHQLVIPWFILGKLVLNTILDFLFVIQKFIIKQEWHQKCLILMAKLIVMLKSTNILKILLKTPKICLKIKDKSTLPLSKHKIAKKNRNLAMFFPQKFDQKYQRYVDSVVIYIYVKPLKIIMVYNVFIMMGMLKEVSVVFLELEQEIHMFPYCLLQTDWNGHTDWKISSLIDRWTF